jgi:hypothetical protein
MISEAMDNDDISTLDFSGRPFAGKALFPFICCEPEFLYRHFH